MSHPVVGSYEGFTEVVKFGNAPAPAPFAAPALGQHSDQILAANGYSAEEISRLRALGVIR